MGDAPRKGLWARIADDFGKAKQFLRDRKQHGELNLKQKSLQQELDTLLRTLGQRAHAAGAGTDLPAYSDVAAGQSAVESAQAQLGQRSTAVAQARNALSAEQARYDPILQQKRETREQSALRAKKAQTELQAARKDVAAAESELGRIESELRTTQADADRPLPPEPGPAPEEPTGEELLQVEAQPSTEGQATHTTADAARLRREEHQAKVRAYEEAQARRRLAAEDLQRLQADQRRQEQALQQARDKVPPLEQAAAEASAEEQKDAAALAETEQEWNQKRSELDGHVRAAEAEEKAASAASSAAVERLAEAFLAFGRAVLDAGLSHPDITDPAQQARTHHDQLRQVDQQSAALQAEMEQLRGPFVKASFYAVTFALLLTIAIVGIAWLIRVIF